MPAAVHTQLEQAGRVHGAQAGGHAVEHVTQIHGLGVRLQRALFDGADLAELVEHGHGVVGGAHLLAQQVLPACRVAIDWLGGVGPRLQGFGEQAHGLQRLAQVVADAGQQACARALQHGELVGALVQAGDEGVALGQRVEEAPVVAPDVLAVDPHEHRRQYGAGDPQAGVVRQAPVPARHSRRRAQQQAQAPFSPRVPAQAGHAHQQQHGQRRRRATGCRVRRAQRQPAQQRQRQRLRAAAGQAGQQGAADQCPQPHQLRRPQAGRQGEAAHGLQRGQVVGQQPFNPALRGQRQHTQRHQGQAQPAAAARQLLADGRSGATAVAAPGAAFGHSAPAAAEPARMLGTR
jgi:hypothetical protein